MSELSPSDTPPTDDGEDRMASNVFSHEPQHHGYNNNSNSNGNKTCDDDEDHHGMNQVFPVIPHYYHIGTGPKGRGLFATRHVPPNTLLHVAPCLKIECDEYQNWMKYTVLEHYLFNANSGCKLLALGDGSLFNHSRQPNVDYRVDNENEVIRYYSTGHVSIQNGDELCIYYGDNLWFDDADGKNEKESSSDDEATDFLGRISLA